ncbi:SDR family oxidoreductase [Catellatospora chokoriensis]|uniref:Short-chain dehydrogenase n=1 Tax=Catellatospora chokoriensis TaxID=310353 RepID=A0A8J3NV39_9ACTN|nr:SDR family oxidoreductase [Catellatospora chokoriensis]GIF93538.1 short-chain dehydrogenase [Catellatospora chokoriensis]
MTKVVVVTGGTRGIGLGLVRELAARGARVVYCGRSVDSVKRAEEQVPQAFGVVADVTDRAAVQRLWDAAVERHGRVDIWINNAGMSPARRKLWELDPAALDATVDLNLRALLHASAVVLAGMAAQGAGALWNMEGFGSNGMLRPGLTVYGATKRAVTYTTDSLAKEVEGTGVTVHHLSPGMVVTDLLTHDYTPEELAQAKKIFNILADRVETVTPWLAEKVLAGAKNGARVAWLTRGKAFVRFLTAFRKRDVFGEDA